LGTDIQNADSDGDSYSDLFEVLLSFMNPLESNNHSCPHSDTTQDQDFDGLSNCEEFILGTSYQIADTDRDGITDYLEVVNRLNPEKESSSDSDLDGVSDKDEVKNHTIPTVDEGADWRSEIGYQYSTTQISSGKHNCYQFKVSNISLLETFTGENRIYLYAYQKPIELSKDYGTYQIACVNAQYFDTGHRLPASGKYEIPQTVWKLLKEFNPELDCISF